MQVGEFFVKLGLIPDKKSWGKADAILGGLTKRLAMLAVSDGFRKLEESVNEVVELGGKLNDTAAATGQNVEELQELGYAAEQSGGSMEGMAKGLSVLSKNMYAAANGGKEQAKMFREAGIAVTDANGQLRPAADVLGDLADHLAATEDATAQHAVGVKFLSKAYLQIGPSLLEGRAGLERMRQEARDLGIVLSSDEVGALDNFGDDLGRFNAGLRGLKQQVVVALLPALQGFLSNLLEWIKANRELIKTKVAAFAENLAAVLMVLGKAVMFALEHWRVLAALLIGGSIVGGIMTIVRAVIFFQSALTAAAIKAIASWALILGPIFLVAAAIVLLGVLIYKYRDQVVAALKSAWVWWVMLIQGIRDKVISTVGKVFDAITSIPGKIVGFFARAWARIKSTAASLWSAIKSGIRSAFQFIAGLPIIRHLLWLVNKLEAWRGRARNGIAAAGAELEQNLRKSGALKGAPGFDADGNPLAPSREARLQAIRQANPSISNEEDIQRIERYQSAVMRVAPSTANLSMQMGDINIYTDATARDPKAVGSEVRQVVREELGTQFRQAASNLGGKQ